MDSNNIKIVTLTHTHNAFVQHVFVCMRFRLFEILKFTQLTRPIKYKVVFSSFIKLITVSSSFMRSFIR